MCLVSHVNTTRLTMGGQAVVVPATSRVWGLPGAWAPAGDGCGCLVLPWDPRSVQLLLFLWRRQARQPGVGPPEDPRRASMAQLREGLGPKLICSYNNHPLLPAGKLRLTIEASMGVKVQHQ